VQTSILSLLSLLLSLTSTTLVAEEGAVNIREGVPFITVQTADGPFRIERESDTQNEIFGDWALTSRPRPP